MQDNMILHLTEALRRHKARLGSAAKLAESVHIANDYNADCRVDRRALERLCQNNVGSVQLRLDQIEALDRWLRAEGEKPLLAKRRSLVDSIWESYDINFLIASKFLEDWQTDVISRWDLRATTWLLRTPLNQRRVGIRDISGQDSWDEEEEHLEDAANIAIASPVANFASTAIMSRMIGISPHRKVHYSELPFFIVGQKRDEKLDLSFIRPRSELDGTKDAHLLPESRDMRALVINGKSYRNNSREEYALILAQRIPKQSHVQLVLCGLTGRGTYQLARIIQSGEPAEILPPLESNQEHQPIFMVVYRLEFDSAWDSGPRDSVVEFTAVDGPRLLREVNGQWQPEV